MANPKTILLKGNGVQKEDVAAAAVTPGELLEFDGSGELQAHSTAGGNAAKMVCLEEAFVGDDIDTDYSAGDNVVYLNPWRGSVLYMFLADGENVSKGDPLESDGSGNLQAHTAQAVDEGGTATYTIYAEAVVGYAAEDLDNSGAGQRNRIRVEIA